MLEGPMPSRSIGSVGGSSGDSVIRSGRGSGRPLAACWKSSPHWASTKEIFMDRELPIITSTVVKNRPPFRAHSSNPSGSVIAIHTVENAAERSGRIPGTRGREVLMTESIRRRRNESFAGKGFQTNCTAKLALIR